MSADTFLAQAFVYLAAAVVAVPVASRLGLGSVLGYLLAGVLIGPVGLGLVGTEGQDVMHFAEFGVVMMLFLVGLELEPSLLWRLRSPVLGLGGLQVLFTAALVAIGGKVLGFGWSASIAIGLTLAMSSTALVLQSLAEKNLLKSSAGQSAFAVLLFQDIAVIPTLAVFPLLAAAGGATGGASSHGAPEAAALPAWQQTALVLAAVLAIVGAGRFLVRPALRAVARTRLRELFTAATLLLVIGVALLMRAVGLSPALGTFLGGVVLANSEYRHELVSDLEPFKGLLLGVFFIAVGAGIDFHLMAEAPARTAALTVAVVFAKFAVLAALGLAFRIGRDQWSLFAFALAGVGEFAFVLFSYAGQLGVLPPSVAGPLTAVVALTMALTPLLLLVNERVVRPRLTASVPPARDDDPIDEKNPVVVAGFGRFGQTVGRLLKANGVGATFLDGDADRVELLRKMGLKVFYGDASRHDLLHAAGAGEARLLVLALDDPQKNLELAHAVRRHFPRLTVLARAEDRTDAYELMDAGVSHIYRETLDSSLRMGVDALRLLGHRGYRAQRAARIFQRHDEESVRQMAGMRRDRASYISTARQRIAELEDVLRTDLATPDETRDAGWDSESLRDDMRRTIGSASK